ncbi:MAG: type II toxin-antitoxin system mRNA interferase toxin, RelE/StbE family [Candidatus Daviesbacteria bacterium]|nr:type II toxin-antitoxin system mRNA interferase toxin, RelE/StbE family [Candidatus Daviesbacteria bacterium]
MKVQLSPKLIDKLKKQDVRIRHSFKKAIELFAQDPNNLELDNHELEREWKGFRSIDVTADLRAIYQEVRDEDEPMAYFVALGTHEYLYKPAHTRI